MRVIGIVGKAGVGKDTVADMIINQCGGVKYSLASPIKEIGKLFGFTHDQMYLHDEKEKVDPFWQITPRKFMQLVGTDMFRDHLNKDCWTKLAQRFIDSSKSEVVIIPDIRFPNEVNFVKTNNGIIIKVERPVKSKLSDESQNHVSEILIDDIKADYVIINNLDLRLLTLKVKDIIDDIDSK